MVFTRFSPGWFSPGFHNMFTRFSQGFHKVFTRFSQHFHKVFTRFSQGFHKIFTRFSQGFHQVFTRLSLGFHKVFTRFSQHFHNFRAYRPQERCIWSKIWHRIRFWSPFGRSSSQTWPKLQKTNFLIRRFRRFVFLRRNMKCSFVEAKELHSKRGPYESLDFLFIGLQGCILFPIWAPGAWES